MKLSLFSVHIETRGDDPVQVTDAAIGGLVKALGPHNGIVTGGGGLPGWDATIAIESSTALSAIAEASALIRRHASAVLLPDWPIVRAVAIREDILDEEFGLDSPQSLATFLRHLPGMDEPGSSGREGE
jgi:hypothetical protein